MSEKGPDDPFQRVPLDVIEMILRLSGNPMGAARVSKKIHHAVTLSSARHNLNIAISAGKVSPTVLLESGKKSEQVARAIIERMGGGYSLTELLHLAGSHESLAHEVYETPGLKELLSGDQLSVLGRQLSTARLILKNETLAAKLTGGDLELMGRAHLEIAQLIFDLPPTFRTPH